MINEMMRAMEHGEEEKNRKGFDSYSYRVLVLSVAELIPAPFALERFFLLGPDPSTVPCFRSAP